MAESKKLSIQEILAAARAADGGEASAPPAAEAAKEEAKPAETEPKAAAPPAPKAKPGEKPSVADIIAMAKANKSADAAVEKPPAEPKKPSPKAKPAAAAKAGKAPAAKSAERMSTASILAAAKKDAKRGPMSKADAPATSPAAAKKPAKAAADKVKPSLPSMPEKPAFAKPKKAEKAPDAKRRIVFLGLLFGTAFATGMTLLTTTVGLWTLALARFMFPNILTEPPSRFKVGFAADFAPGQVETKFKAQFGIWLVNGEYQGQQMIYALSTVCTHLGCTPNWLEAEQKFKCPCHGSGFYKDGVNFEGPAPRPLERYAIRVADDGQIEVDKSRKFQEEMGQWQDNSSYVPV